MNLDDWVMARTVAAEIGISLNTVIKHGKKGTFSLLKAEDGRWYVPKESLPIIRNLKRQIEFYPARVEAAR